MLLIDSDKLMKPETGAGLSQPRAYKKILDEIGVLAAREQIPAYVVGGYLRDLCLERATKDVDIVVVGDGVRFANAFASKMGIRKPVAFPAFGTAQIQFQGLLIEFVTAREESYRRESRKPDVKKADLKTDLLRRDFTINTLAMPLWGPDSGTLIDELGARDDLKKGIIRTPLDPFQTFDDDPLRIMRAIRFATQLEFSIDKKTFEGMKEHRERLSIVSQERITDEFLKILSAPKPSVGFHLMKKSGVFKIVFPEIDELSGVEKIEGYQHKDVFLHTIKVVDNVARETSNLLLRFTALVHDIAKPPTKKFVSGIGWTFYGHEELGARMLRKIIPRMRLSKEYLEYSQKLVRLHLRPINLADEGVTDSAVRRLIVAAGEELNDLLTLCRADITSNNPRRANAHLKNFDFVARRVEEVREKDRLREFKSPVNGHEIMQTFGIPPGRLIGNIKAMIEEAILDGVIPNEHDAAFEYMMKIKDEILGTGPGGNEAESRNNGNAEESDE